MREVLTPRKMKGAEILLFLLGLFSTMQIVSLFGVTLFNILLFATFLYLIAFKGIKSKNVDILFLFTVISILIATLNALFGDIVPSSYHRPALSGFVWTFLIFSIYALARDKDESSALNAFFNGLYCSCLLQIFWCVLQLICWYAFRSDINFMVFNRLLHMAEETSSYRNGNLVCTGFCWHAANLVPVVLFCYLKAKHLPVKLVCIFVSFMSKSATLGIAVILCFLWDFIRCLSTIGKKKFKKEELTAALVALVFLLVCLFVAWDFVSDAINSVLQRLKDITSKEGGNSSATHFSYYLRLPEILAQSPFFAVLFGYGVSCSGYPFTLYFGQYADMVWVVESDFVNILLNQGFFGFFVFYFFLFDIVLRSIKTSSRSMVFTLIVVLCGVFYNVQFGWTILVELMLYRALCRRTDVFERKKEAVKEI